MKKFTNVLLTMSCLFLSTLMLAGCGKDGEAGANGMEPVHAALILQPISTAPVVNVEAARDLLETVCRVPGSSVSIIVADGEPWEYASVAPDDMDTSLSADMQKQILEERVQELIAVAASAESANPETDLRKAVEMRYLVMPLRPRQPEAQTVCGKLPLPLSQCREHRNSPHGWM